MKKKNIIIIFLVVLLDVAIVVSITLLDNKYNLRHFFDDFESETDEPFLQIAEDFVIYDKNGIKVSNTNSVLSKRADVVFCCVNDRIYFGYASRAPEESEHQKREWHIASVDLLGNDLLEHYRGILFDETDPYPTIWDLSFFYSTEFAEDERWGSRWGGLYDGEGHIYLTGNVKTICYDIASDTVEEIDTMPETSYHWQSGKGDKDRGTTTLTITRGSEEKTVTFDSLAKSNEYAKQIYELSPYKTGVGDPYLLELCSKTIQDEIYIICTVLRWSGTGFKVVFKYDFDTEQVQYIMHQKMFNPVKDYNFVLIQGKK